MTVAIFNYNRYELEGSLLAHSIGTMAALRDLPFEGINYCMRKCVFLDRDGIIIEDKGYISSIVQITFIKNALECIRLLNEQGFCVIVVTNQSGVARGYYTVRSVITINNYLQEFLESRGAYIKQFYFCPHYEKGVIKVFSLPCKCRKPNPGMLLDAKKDHQLDFTQTYLIGDKITDIQAGNRAGVKKSYLIPTNGDMTASVEDILQQHFDH